VEPTEKKSRTETFNGSRPKPRTDRLDDKDAKCNTERALKEPAEDKPTTDSELPHRTKFRMESDEPNATLSKIDMVLPKRPMPRRLREEPRYAASRMLVFPANGMTDCLVASPGHVA
jgi:hypothetical protein